MKISSFAGGFGAGEAAFEELDLAVVVGFMFGDVEPFVVIVHAGFGVESGQPFVVALL